jgi:hypothetical protein
VLKDPKADNAAKAEALQFVIHFIGELHQPSTRTTATRAEMTGRSSLMASPMLHRIRASVSSLTRMTLKLYKSQWQT